MSFVNYDGTITWDKSISVLSFGPGNDDHLHYQLVMSPTEIYVRNHESSIEVLPLTIPSIANKNINFQYNSIDEVVRYNYTFGPQNRNTVNFDLYKNQDPDKVKISLNGSVPNSVSVNVPFNFHGNADHKKQLVDERKVFYGNYNLHKPSESGTVIDSTLPLYGLYFDWGDIISNSQYGSNNLSINIPSGNFSLDPSAGYTIATTLYPCENQDIDHIFYYGGKWWFFYVEPSNMLCRTFNGSTWSNAYTIIGPSTYGSSYVDSITCAYQLTDQGVFHYVTGNHNYGGMHGYYRRGTVNPSTDDIAWDTATQTTVHVTDGSSTNLNPSVIFDRNGYAWASYYRRIDGGNAVISVYKNATTTGTWTTEAGFPKTFAPYSNVGGGATLGGNKLFTAPNGSLYCVALAKSQVRIAEINTSAVTELTLSPGYNMDPTWGAAYHMDYAGNILMVGVNVMYVYYQLYNNTSKSIQTGTFVTNTYTTARFAPFVEKETGQFYIFGGGNADGAQSTVITKADWNGSVLGTIGTLSTEVIAFGFTVSAYGPNWSSHYFQQGKGLYMGIGSGTVYYYEYNKKSDYPFGQKSM